MQPSLYPDRTECDQVRARLDFIHRTIHILAAQNRRLRRIAFYQGFVVVIAVSGFALAANWRASLMFYAFTLCCLPFFAKR